MSNAVKVDSGSQPKCGIIMPIAAMGDCTETHWTEVLNILTEAVEDVGFTADIVSNADEVTVIQKTIVQNLYELPVVVCDVSQKNPNVMFELGMRLAFDMPTIIVKDDQTSFSFDTGVIEHLEYPRDLRFAKINQFKEKLGKKVRATFEKRSSEPDYSTFLRHFGRFEVAKLETTEVTGQEFIMNQLTEIREEISEIALPPTARRPLAFPAGHEIDICCGPMSAQQVEEFEQEMRCDNRLNEVRSAEIGDHFHLYAASEFDSISHRRELEKDYQKRARDIHSQTRRRKRTKAERSLEAIQNHFLEGERPESDFDDSAVNS